MVVLHLTDAHFGQAGSASYALGAQREFFDDLGHLIARGAAIDLVIFSGDIANTGAYSEFTRAHEFLERLIAEFARDVPILTVPGNHDLVRPDPAGPVVKLLARETASTLEQLGHAYTHEVSNDYRVVVEGAFDAYTAWATALPWWPADWRAGLLPGDGVARVDIAGRSLTVLALNTSTLQLSDAMGEGTLALLEAQVDEVARLALDGPGSDVYVLVTHHPPEWLDESSRSLLADGLLVAVPVSLHLFGHRHVAEFTSLGRGADPRVLHRLQGRSYFGQEYLADGRTRRELGYSLIDIDVPAGSFRVAPRRATRRPAGGVTFEAERSRAWFLPKGEDWTAPLALRDRDRAERAASSPPAPASATLVPPAPADDLRPLHAALNAVESLVGRASMRQWRSLPTVEGIVRNHGTLLRLLPAAGGLTDAERAYVWALVLMVRARADFALRFPSIADFLDDSEWAREVADVTTSNERLVSRAVDVAAPPDIRALLAEWLIRRALGRSAQVWRSPDAGSAARRLAATLESRPAHVDSLATRLLADAAAVATGALTTERLRENWALALSGTEDPAHVRGARVLPFAVVLASLEFDPILDGAELVEQVGVVADFTVEALHEDISSLQWVLTAAGDFALIGVCSDPAIEVAFESFAGRLRRLGAQLRAASADAGLSPILESRLVTDLAPRRDGDLARYATPVTRLVMNTDRIRSLLMGEQLYGQPRLAIRELYQNALDACRHRSLRHDYLRRTGRLLDEAWEGEIAFRACYDEHGNVPVLECADNGVGMTGETLAECFLSAGTRFVETPGFADEQANWLSYSDELRLYPNSTFGIGAYSYFMLADVVDVFTRVQLADGSLSDGAHLQVNSGSSVARISAWPEAATELPHGGTIVRLHLRPEFRSTSRLQLANFLDEVILRSPFGVTIQEGHETTSRTSGEFSPEVRGTPSPAWVSGLSSAWWRIGHGPLLADGVRTPTEVVGLMVNLHGERKPVLRVDRNAVVNWDGEWVLDNTAGSAAALASWDGISLAWLWSFAEAYPVYAERLYEAVRELRPVVPLGQSKLWQTDVDLRVVGCFPGDRYLLRELYDGRWETEYTEIEIPEVMRNHDRFHSLTVRFPGCLRPWRRCVWQHALPELFEGWDPDASRLTWARAETMRQGSHDASPVWEPERLEGLDPPKPLDALLLASQPSIMDVDILDVQAGHTEMIDIVALVHTSYRCRMTLGEAVRRLSRFSRFGLLGVPSLSRDGARYTASLLDCQIVASLGRAWPAAREVNAADLLSLVPLCQEHGLTVDEVLDATDVLLRALGVAAARASGSRDVFRGHVPSAREVRFLGFGPYDTGRELRFGRGTRAALVRAGHRADMREDEVKAVVRRYAGFGLSKYRQALKAIRFRAEDREHLQAWSAEFDSRAPWVDEEVFRRGFISDRPSSHEELLGHALFFAALHDVPLQEAVDAVLAFPGLTDEQRGEEPVLVGEVTIDDRDIEMLRDRIGETSRYADKRLGGIGQTQLVRRPWSVLELKAAAEAMHATLEEVFERLGKFAFLGVVLPDCGPQVITDYQFDELETALLTSTDWSLSAASHFPSHHESPKPIIMPIPSRHVMAVAAENKLTLGTVVDALDALVALGVRSDVAPLPEELRDFLPSTVDVHLARRLTGPAMGYGILEHAFASHHSVGYVCDLLAPWLTWHLGRDVSKRLETLKRFVGDLEPTYSDVSFIAAAIAQARSAAGVLTPVGACVLAAQANVDIGTVADLGRRLATVLAVDGIAVDVDDLSSSVRAVVPDSAWVLAAAPSAIVGARLATTNRLLGLTPKFVGEVQERLAIPR